MSAIVTQAGVFFVCDGCRVESVPNFFSRMPRDGSCGGSLLDPPPLCAHRSPLGWVRQEDAGGPHHWCPECVGRFAIEVEDE